MKIGCRGFSYFPLNPYKNHMSNKLLLAAALLATSLGIRAQAHLSVNAQSHDFGLLTYNKPATATFTLTNIGNDTLRIHRVTTSCACTPVEYPRTPLAPGEQATISATYDAKTMGHFHKFIHIYSNSTPSLMRLALKGEVLLEGAEKSTGLTEQIGDFLLNTRNLEFEPSEKGHNPKATLRLLNTGKTPIDLQLLHLPPYITMEAHPRTLPPRRKGTIELTLKTGELPDYGLTQTSVYLARYAADKVNPDNEITLSSILLPDFSHLTQAQLDAAPRIELSDYEFDLGTVSPRKNISRTAVLTNQGRSKLKIEKLQVFSPAISLSLGKRTLKPGESCKLKLKLHGKHFYRFKGETKALIISNDPEQPFIIIQLKAKKEIQ